MKKITGKRRLLTPYAVFLAVLTLFPLAAPVRQALALTILSIRDFSHSAGVSSSFNRSSSSGASGTEIQQEFTEDYSAGFSYIVLSPYLLKGDAMLDLEWLQHTDDDDGGRSKSAGTQLHYNVNGQVLPKKPYPMNFSASSSRQTVTQPFTPTYDTESDSLTMRIAMLNSRIPADFGYAKQSQKNFGLNQNVGQESHSMSFSAKPALGDFGSLSLGVSLNESKSSAERLDQESKNSSAAARINYHNSWSSPRDLARGFSLSYGYQQTSGVTLVDNESLNANLDWEFGKVLHGDMDYFYSKSSSLLQSTQSHGATASLSHRLLGSLSTGLRVSAAQDSYDAGDNRSYNGGVKLAYDRRLPRSSNVDVGYSYSTGVRDRTGTTSVVNVVDERHPVPAIFPRRIPLLNPTFLGEGIRVVGAQSQLIYPADFFAVVPEGIELLDFLPGDSEVLISYGYLQDPSVTSLSMAHTVSTALTLYKNRYRIYANASFANQKLLKGEATSLTLSNSSRYVAGATASLDRHTLASEYGLQKDYGQDLHYFTNSWGYTTPYLRGDVTVNANDRLSWQSSSARETPWVNSLTVQGTYRRMFRYVGLKMKAEYGNALLEGGGMSHVAGVGVNIEGKFGKLSALLNSNLSWNFADGSNSSSQGIGVALRRSF